MITLCTLNAAYLSRFFLGSLLYSALVCLLLSDLFCIMLRETPLDCLDSMHPMHPIHPSRWGHMIGVHASE